MSGFLSSAVMVIHYPTNTSAVAVGGWGRPFIKLKKEAMRILKIRIIMAKKAIWSNKLVRTYQGNPEKISYYRGMSLVSFPDENEFNLDEIFKKENNRDK